MTPDAYKNQRIPDEITPISDEIPSRIDGRNESVYIQDENPDDKENIPPIDDKENIPPPPLHAMPRNENPIAYKTPENTIDNNESSVLPNDLQKGVDLINALVDSRTTDCTTKKKLIRKIVRRLLRSKDTKDITQMIMSYSEKSNSKIYGVNLLDSEGSDQSGEGKPVTDTISGVSVLGSSSSVASASVEDGRTTAKSERKANTVQTVEKDEKGKRIEQEADENEQKEIKDWLLPVTQSEIEKENARKSKILQTIKTIEEKQPKTIPAGRSSEHIKNMEKPSKNNEILEFLENEKKTHYNWIDQEIEHLKNLKLLLQNVNAIDSDESKGSISDEKINSVYAKFKHKRNNFSVYENFRCNLKHTSGNVSNISSAIIGLDMINHMINIFVVLMRNFLFQIHPNLVTTAHDSRIMAKWAVEATGYTGLLLNHRFQQFHLVQK